MLSKKVTGIVAYITWIGLLVALIAGDKEGARFHMNQALVIWLVGTVGSFLPDPIGLLITVYCFFCWILGLVYAAQEMEKEVPLLGKIKLLR